MQPALIVIILACTCRLLFARYTGLGIDESYMVAASNQFDLSYFDHPLASWWLEIAARNFAGSEASIIVRFPFVALSALSSWLLFLLTRRLFSDAAGFWAVLAYTASPVFSLAFGCWILPDGPLDAALLATAYMLTQAIGLETKPDPRYWLGAGACAGLAVLSKYSAILVLLGAALFILTDPAARKQLRTPYPWIAAAIAMAFFTPVIWWNATHDWQSFAYQSGRATGAKFHPAAFFTIFGGEALFLLPWIWVPMVVLLISALKNGRAVRKEWFLALLAVIPIMLFSVIGIWSGTRILYHWATPGYLMLFPLLGNWLATWRPGLRNAIASFSVSLLLLGAGSVAVAENFWLLPHEELLFPAGKSPLLQAIDWTSLNSEIPPYVQVIAAQRWYDAGKVSYGIGGRIPVTVLGGDPHQFANSAPPGCFLGQTVLILAMPGDESDVYKTYAPDFRYMLPGPALTVADHGHVLLVIPTILGVHMLRAPQP
jgi:4-amino-4-deoxy-L-arabinose transferase-like glycosyltransferase